MDSHLVANLKEGRYDGSSLPELAGGPAHQQVQTVTRRKQGLESSDPFPFHALQSLPSPLDLHTSTLKRSLHFTLRD
jgi:hypothetical protein